MSYSWREIATFVISMTVVLGFFGLVFLLAITGHLTPGQQDFITGVIVGNFTAAVSFYVGSSQGSTSKNGTIERLSDKTP